MTESEKKVAAKMVNLFRTYRVKDAVEEKGEKARVHSGVVAQDLIEAFQSEGLDAHRYGLFCYDDVWMVDGKDELFETVYTKNGDRNFVDENGVQREYTADDEGVEEVKEGTGIFADKDTPGAVATPGLYSIRYEELLCFVVGGVLKDLQTTEAELKIAKADLETTKADHQKLESRVTLLETALTSVYNDINRDWVRYEKVDPKPKNVSIPAEVSNYLVKLGWACALIKEGREVTFQSGRTAKVKEVLNQKNFTVDRSLVDGQDTLERVAVETIKKDGLLNVAVSTVREVSEAILDEGVLKKVDDRLAVLDARLAALENM